MAENTIQSALAKVRQTASQILKPAVQATQDTTGFFQRGQFTPVQGFQQLARPIQQRMQDTSGFVQQGRFTPIQGFQQASAPVVNQLRTITPIIGAGVNVARQQLGQTPVLPVLPILNKVVPQIPSPTVGQAAEFARENIIQPGVRVAPETFLTAKEFITQKPQRIETPKTAVGRFFLGDQPLESVQQRLPRRSTEISSFLKNAGMSEGTSQFLAPGLALAGITAGAYLDLLPGVDDILVKGGKKVIGKEIAQVVTKQAEQDAVQLATRNISNKLIEQGLAKDVALKQAQEEATQLVKQRIEALKLPKATEVARVEAPKLIRNVKITEQEIKKYKPYLKPGENFGRSDQFAIDIVGSKEKPQAPKDFFGNTVKEGDIVESSVALSGETIRNKVFISNPYISRASGQLNEREWIGNGILPEKRFVIVERDGKPFQSNLARISSVELPLTKNEKIAQQAVENITGTTPKIEPPKAPEQIKKTTDSVETAPIGQVERGFSQTVRESGKTAQEVKDIFVKQLHSPITNKNTIAEADRIIANNLDEAINLAKNGESTALNNAIGLRLVEKLQKERNFVQAADILESVSRKPTSQGQAIQILAYWSKFTPTGAVRYAQTLLDRAQIASKLETKKLAPEVIERITKLAEDLQKLPDGRAKTIKTAELVDEVTSVVPPSLLSKISAFQTMAQLLNPKTAIRNILGNFLFQGTENLARFAALPADVLTSLVTGKRSILAPNLAKQVSGFRAGFREGLEDALKGIDTSNVASQFDIQGKTFRSGVLGTLEKILNIELKAPDRAFFRAAFDESLDMQMRLAKVAEPTQEMIERATYDGLYKTFQDKNVVSNVFSGLKRALNVNKEFGLGDVILKYPKTPGALLMRGLEYSPLGFVRSVFEMAQPLFGRQFNQRDFVDAMGRAFVGTSGLMTTGAILYNLGIITGAPPEDKDLAATERAEGLGAYRVNVSALKRFVATGFNADSAKKQPGDQLVSYDWIQPAAIGISMGANIAENNNKVKPGSIVDTLISSVQGGAETIATQPLIKNFTNMFRGYDLIRSLIDTVKGIPSSFIPTVFSQATQLLDNRVRETYSPVFMEDMINRVKAKIPFVASTLPGKYTVFGEPMERYQDNGNTLFNVMFNPAFVSTVKGNPEATEVLRIYETTGETQQAPRIVDRSVKINGQNRELTGQEIADYQQYVGTRTKEYYNQIINSPRYLSLSDEEKAKQLVDVLSSINSAAKIELFGNQPKNVSAQTKFILGGGDLTENKSFKYGNEYFIRNEDGNVQAINIDAPINMPTLTGNAEIDKVLMSQYNGKLTSRRNNIVKLLTAGQISLADAEQKIAELQTKKITKAKVSKGRKSKKVTLKKVKMPKVKAIKLTKAKAIKLTTIKPIKFAKLKSPKTARQRKLKTIKVRA